MADDLKRTPLYEEHVKLGGKLIPFAGFEMPVQYPDGVKQEHLAVRKSAGLFDVSHMGEFIVKGDGAEGFVNRIVANDVSRLSVGQAQYSVMCKGDGGIVDDLLIYKFSDRYRLVVNAANIEKDWNWVLGQLADFEHAARVEIVDESDDVALLALQGPESETILEGLTDEVLSAVGYYRFIEGRVDDAPCVISRTGYTGEDGFELYCAPDAAVRLWNSVLQAGGQAVKPVGLGARDSLRLEMGYALYGNDIDEGTTPLEAGLAWTVKLDKGDFVGRDALRAQKEKGLTRKLCGFTLSERGFPRPGHEIRCGGKPAAVVRSGTVGPSLGEGIGTGYLPIEDSRPDTEIAVVIRERPVAAVVTRMPFYREGSVKR